MLRALADRCALTAWHCVTRSDLSLRAHEVAHTNRNTPAPHDILQEAAWARHLDEQGITSISNGLILAELTAVGEIGEAGQTTRGHVNVEVGELPVARAWSTLDARTHTQITEAKRRLWG